jgi:hypothetical protein
MRNLLRSEWRKVMTTKLWWGMLLGALAVTALSVVTQIAAFSSVSMGPPGQPVTDQLTDPANQRSIAASAAAAGVFALIVGIILLTTEFRHLTSRPTFLIQPRRGRVIGAKLIVAAVVGIIYAIACTVIVVAVMVPWLAAKGISIGWVSHGVLGPLVGTVFAVTIYAVVGVGIGVLVRNQIAAVIGALVYFLVIEELILLIPVVKACYPYLPGPAATALSGSPSRGTGMNTLTPVQGGLVFLGWSLGLALCGWMLTMRRDIP